MEIANPNSPAKQWNAECIKVEPEFSASWGIKSELMQVAVRILFDNNLASDPGISDSGLRFEHFQKLVRFLDDEGYGSPDINISLTSFEKENAKETTDDKLQEEMAQVLSTFYSIYAPIPAAAVNQQTMPDVLPEAIAQNYFLKETTASNTLLNVLKAISKRITRVHCRDITLLKLATYNPFCVIDETDQQWGLIPYQKNAALTNRRTLTELVVFTDFAESDRRSANQFLRFYTWFMLLNMGSMSYKDVYRIRFEREGRWIALEELPAESPEQLLIKPDYYLSFDAFRMSQTIQFHSPTEELIDIYGVYFSGRFDFVITKGYTTSRTLETGERIHTFDSEHFFRDYDYLNNRKSNVYPLYKADYLKIIVVKKDFQSNSLDSLVGRAEWGEGTNPDFFKLITANESDIYACYTIGLLFNKKNQPEPLNGKTILIAGSSSSRLSTKELLMAEALGQYLAQRGYKIITSGSKGVESTVAIRFKNYLAENDISDKERSIQLVEGNQKLFPDYGMIETLSSKDDWHEVALKRSDAVITIGGSSGTKDVITKAFDKKIPVIPIPATGGESKKGYLQMIQRQLVLQTDKLFSSLDKKLTGPEDAEAIVKVIGELLTTPFIEWNPNMPKKDFIKMVEQVYRKTSTVIADDTQKNRWGGEAQRNGKTISATVVQITGKLLMCDVTLQVSGVSEGEWVAFFLHHYFPNEIEYVQAKNGLAEYKLEASEAFAVGAMTADGTTLELDLQLQTGYPKTFYYPVPETSFKEKVEQLLNERKPTVSDDRQKNRWDGLSVGNGLEMRASVQENVLHGMFDITVTIQSLNKKTGLGDQVAFFLHESFLDEVMYVNVINGIATLELVAYEAFTIGAYTSSGVMLELDMQQQTGYPKSFYYKQ
jgi:predicted Rossmann-fold nucleotide-binding protein